MSNSRPTIDVNRTLLGSGVVLLCVGGMLLMAGTTLAAAAVAQAARKWIEQLDESPSEMAHRRIHQLKVAAEAGSKAWRDEAR